jgi:centromeric protein E
MNEQSSRSHSVLRVIVESRPGDDTGVGSIVRTSTLSMVDLAGSEGVSRTKAEGIRFREGQNINKSLLALSKVIHRLSQTGSKQSGSFINFRDSKLTRILQPSLGGMTL